MKQSIESVPPFRVSPEGIKAHLVVREGLFDHRGDFRLLEETPKDRGAKDIDDERFDRDSFSKDVDRSLAHERRQKDATIFCVEEHLFPGWTKEDVLESFPLQRVEYVMEEELRCFQKDNVPFQ